ncbi:MULTISPECIES: permease [unclassified Agromyces]|uniref:permease n=1 Tax=unclassified Agromyces TaxID=2639701 RepID=UPI003014ABFD
MSSPASAPTRSAPTARRATRRTVGFAVGVAAVLLLSVRSFAPAETGAALSDGVRDGITLAISVVIESLPFVFLGIVLSIAVQLFLPADFLVRRLPRNPWVRRAVVSMFGVLLPVCECGNVPLARGLMLRGLSVGESMTFLLAAPILNPVTIVVTYQAFGWEDGILAWRIVGGFLVANLIGWIFSRHPDPMRLLTPGFQATCAHAADEQAAHAGGGTGGRGSASAKARQAVRMFADETSAMLPALMVGSAIAGAIQIAISRDVLVAVGQDAVWSVVALMLLAFVISICSNVDAFFALAFGSTFLPGAIIAFLVFGPMIDIKMLALMRTTFTARTLVQVTAVVALASAAIGLGVNALA